MDEDVAKRLIEDAFKDSEPTQEESPAKILMDRVRDLLDSPTFLELFNEIGSTCHHRSKREVIAVFSNLMMEYASDRITASKRDRAGMAGNTMFHHMVNDLNMSSYEIVAMAASILGAVVLYSQSVPKE
jgi:hypothetical protein